MRHLHRCADRQGEAAASLSSNQWTDTLIMTMPHERTRALRCAYETLVQIRDGTHFQDTVRGRAGALLCEYPKPELIAAWIEINATSIPESAANAIDATGALLRELWYSDSCPVEVRDQLSYTLRHFPEEGHAKLWARSCALESITEWLLPEDY